MTHFETVVKLLSVLGFNERPPHDDDRDDDHELTFELEPWQYYVFRHLDEVGLDRPDTLGPSILIHDTDSNPEMTIHIDFNWDDSFDCFRACLLRRPTR